jgi:hypothetical protein
MRIHHPVSPPVASPAAAAAAGSTKSERN